MSVRSKALRVSLCICSAIAGFSAAAVSTSAVAAPNIATDSAVFVEHRQANSVRSLEPANDLSRGDRVVTILRWYRLGGDGDFTITNPLPKAITYQKSTRSDELVSVDGGRTWGRLGQLRIGARYATPEDVTHVRWRISARRAQHGSGQIAYRGIVR